MKLYTSDIIYPRLNKAGVFKIKPQSLFHNAWVSLLEVVPHMAHRLRLEIPQFLDDPDKAMYTDDAEELRRHAPYIRALRGVFKRGQSDPLPGFNFFIGSAKKLVKRCELTKEQAEVYQINQTVCWPAFSSTSEADKGGHEAFTGLTFCIRCRDSTEDPNEIQGYFPASIKPWSCFPDENEVLIPPHYMLRVHNIKYNDQPDNPNKWVIELELADLPPVWDIITQKNWHEFKTWAQAHPDLVDTTAPSSMKW